MKTIEEIDAALQLLPRSPTRDEDVFARAELTWKRAELVNEIQRNQRAAKAAAEFTGGLVDVVVPHGGPTCIESGKPGGFYYAVLKDGRLVLPMPWSEFCKLIRSTRNNTSLGVPAEAWIASNPNLLDLLPKNDPPPPAAPPY